MEQYLDQYLMVVLSNVAIVPNVKGNGNTKKRARAYCFGGLLAANSGRVWEFSRKAAKLEKRRRRGVYDAYCTHCERAQHNNNNNSTCALRAQVIN